jgi:hypothetical protein
MIGPSVDGLLLGRTVATIELGVGWFITVGFDMLPDGDFLWIQQAAWRVFKVGTLCWSCSEMESAASLESLQALLLGRTIVSTRVTGADLILDFDDSVRLEVLSLDPELTNNWSLFVGAVAGGPSDSGVGWENRDPRG